MTGEIIDISPEIHSGIGVFPGDQKYERNVSMSLSQGHHLTLSSVTTTLHLGAHADAPNHYGEGGEDIASRSLHYYFGECQVISVYVEKKERILPSHLKTEVKAERVLFRTGTFSNPNRWNADFAALSPELIDFLAKKNVILVGIDTPSIDPEDSKDLPSHAAVFRHDMAILEGVVLHHVDDGIYQLAALPLKLRGADASPVRAVLIRH